MDERANPPASGSKDDAFYPSPPADVVPPDIARPGRKFGGARGSTRDEIDAESAEDEKDNHFDEHAQLKRTASGLAGRGMHLVHEPSTRTISSSESTGGGAPPHRELEKKQSARSSVSMGSASDCPDESGFGTFGARASRKASSDGTSGKTFHNAGANSPRAKRFGRGGPGSRRSVNLSTREEEDAALMELYSVIGEENRDKLEFKRNPAGFIIYIELVEVPIDGKHQTQHTHHSILLTDSTHKRSLTGPVPECICMFSQLIVLVVQRCGVSGSFPFWIDSLIYLQELNLSQNYLVGEPGVVLVAGLGTCATVSAVLHSAPLALTGFVSLIQPSRRPHPRDSIRAEGTAGAGAVRERVLRDHSRGPGRAASTNEARAVPQRSNR